MATLQEIEAQIEELKEVLASGVESTSYADKSARFRSVEALQQTLTWLESEKAKKIEGRARSRQRRMVTRDGW